MAKFFLVIFCSIVLCFNQAHGDVTSSGYRYLHYSTYKYKETDFDHHRNDSPSKDLVTFSFEITKSATANVNLSFTLDSMVTKAGIGTQVGWGVTTTKTHSITWEIPPRSTYRLLAGSRWVKVTGTEQYLNQQGKVIRSKEAVGKWTYQTWSDKKPQKGGLDG